MLDALGEKSLIESDAQIDLSKLLPANFRDDFLRAYKYTYRVASAAESGKTVSLWTRIGAAVEIHRDVRRAAIQQSKQLAS
jgi:hypothetical protein